MEVIILIAFTLLVVSIGSLTLSIAANINSDKHYGLKLIILCTIGSLIILFLTIFYIYILNQIQ